MTKETIEERVQRLIDYLNDLKSTDPTECDKVVKLVLSQPPETDDEKTFLEIFLEKWKIDSV